MEALLNPDIFSENTYNTGIQNEDLTVFPIRNWDSHSAKFFKEPTRLTFFEIFWIKEGSTKISIDAENYVLDQKKIHFLSPGRIRCLDWNSRMEGFYISVLPEYFHLLQNRFEVAAIFNYSNGIGSIEIDEEQEEELEQILKRIKKEMVIVCPTKSDLLKAWFSVFLLCLTRNLTYDQVPLSNSNNRDMVRRFLNLIPSEYHQKKLVRDYAEELCITPNYLNSIVKKNTGFPASYHIQQHLVNEAKRYALYSQLRMKEIAVQLGFNDNAHFSKFFKINTGMNYSDYVKKVNTAH